MAPATGGRMVLALLLISLLIILQGVNAAPAAAASPTSTATTKSAVVPLCETGSKASSALLQTAKQQVPQQQRAWASSKSSVVKVRSWDQLVEAAGQHDGAASAVFELQQGPFTATSTLQLKPGMAVLGSNKDKVKITCGKAVGSAVEVDLRGEGSPPRPASSGVLLKGLHISGCTGSAVKVSGGLSASKGVQWGQMPAGLHVVDSTLQDNSADVGGAISAARAAVYLDTVELSGNTASLLGAAVSIEQGLLVALKTTLKQNRAGNNSQVLTLMDGAGAAVFANSSTVLLANSTITGNRGTNVGGCAVKAMNSRGLVVAGCTFADNACTGDGGAVLGGNYAASTCVGGGASLMVASNMPPFTAGKPTQCSLAPKHLAHISDTTFSGDAATQHSCGGSIMSDASWLELHRSSITGNGPASRGGAMASKGSAVVLVDSIISNHSSRSYGGAIFQLRGRFWADHTVFSDAFTEREGGGCVYITDATGVQVSHSRFERCRGRAEGGAMYYQMMYDKPESAPPATVHATTVANCRAGRDGGALNFNRVDMTITDSTFDGNEGYYGGVLNAGNGALSVSNTNFTNNMASAGGQGGTVYTFDLTGANLTDCTWFNNSAYQGAAVYAATYGGESVWTFTRCNFTANVAQQRGAALWTSGTNFTFKSTTFADNKALTAAGVWATNSGTSLPLRMAFDKCTLKGNVAEQSAGMAWVTSYNNVSFSQCSITGNRAGQSAGGLYMQDTPARLMGCVLDRNTARLAAALMLQGANSTVQAVDCRFESNQAADQAGAGVMMAGSSLTLSRTAFSNNSASTAGGALVVLDSAKLSCTTRCNFTRNSAALGGAIAVQSASVRLTGSVLAGNFAPADLVTVVFGNGQHRAGSGGAVFAANATLSMAKCSLQDNRAEAQGGAAQLVSSTATFDGSRFTNNRAVATAAASSSNSPSATAGGAILAGLLPTANKTASARLQMQDCVLSSNTAGFGGAIAVVDTAVDLSTPSPTDESAASTAGAAAPLRVVLDETSLANNTADTAGGALFSNLPSTTISLNSSKVSNNKAGQGGGGIAAVRPAAVKLEDSSISGNRAAFCGGLLLESPATDSVIHSSRFERNVAGQQQQQGVSSDRTFGQLPQWNSTGSGGGLCIIPRGTVSVTKSVITQNTALHGAGMFVQDCVSHTGQPAPPDRASEFLRDSSRASNQHTCGVTVGSKTVISGNKQQAGGSGSALYTTDTAAVSMAPDARAGRVDNRSSIITEAGPAAADSMAAKPSTLLGGFHQQPTVGGTDSMGPVLLVDSGSKLPAVKLQLLDQYGQPLPPSLLQQLTFRAQAASTTADSRSDTNLLGVTSVVPSAGNSSNAEVAFDWLELQGAPGETHNVSFAVLEAPEVTPAVVQVRVKQCQAGQAMLRGRRQDSYAGCTNCTNPLFSFDPSAHQCSTCPPAGTYKVCSGDVLTPADGFWQSHPRSAQLLACPNPAACSRSGTAAQELAAASAAGQQAGGASRGLLAAGDQQTAVAAYQELQCAPGFSGNLCSNCDRSSRVTQTLSHTCRSCTVSRAGSAILFVLVRLFDLSIVMLSVFLVFKERHRRNMAVNGGVVTSDKLRLAMQQGVAVKLSSPATSGPMEVRLDDLKPNTDAAGSTGVDTFLMMFIEFMQLLSIFRLTRIGVVWRSAAEAVLLAMSITPISSYSWMSLECVLPAGLSPQQYAFDSTLASTYIPVALTVVVCGTVFVHNARRAHRLRYPLKDYPPMMPEMLLAGIKAFAYGYPVIVGSVLGLFSCKELNTAAQVPGEVNAAQGTFWNRDLDTTCYQGAHLTYALAVGVPMLLVVVLYPLLQILHLSRQARRQPDGLCDVRFWANYSMLYQDYTQRMYLWGSVRELRQLLLVAVVVVLQAYPVQLQMVGGWLLSLALLLSHAILAPFRVRWLNGLQTAMLAAISFTFYAGVLSSLPNIPTKGVVAVQYFAIAFDLVVALVLLVVLVWRARLWLDWDQDGKVTWSDVKSTVQHQSEITGKAASVVMKQVTSLGSALGSATRSWKTSSTRIPAKPGSQASSRADGLAANDSQCLSGFNSVNTLGESSSLQGALGSGLTTSTGSLGAMSSNVTSRASSSITPPPHTAHAGGAAGAWTPSGGAS